MISINAVELRADEIEARVSQATEKGVSILLYKDARCDMNILDETVGPLNWQRHHSRDNANCIVSIWDDDKKQWIEKEDTGTESNNEAEKGLASDSFKRACFNYGIGRELYTAPFIWFPASECNLKQRTQNNKWMCDDKFEVVSVLYDDCSRKIKEVEIGNRKTGKVRTFSNSVPAAAPKKAAAKKEAPAPAPTPAPAPDPVKKPKVEQKSTRDAIMEKCEESGINPDWIATKCGCNAFNDLSDDSIRRCLKNWKQLVTIFQSEMEVA